jgi:hypothetical protein
MEVYCVWNNYHGLIVAAGFSGKIALQENQELVKVEVTKLPKNWDDWKIINIVEGKGELAERSPEEKEIVKEIRKRAKPKDFEFIFDRERGKKYTVSKTILSFGLPRRRVRGRYLRTAGFYKGYILYRKGVILTFGVYNNRRVFIDTPVHIRFRRTTVATIIIRKGERGVTDSNLNVDFQENDLIRCYVARTGSPLYSPSATMEVAFFPEIQL